MSDVDEAIYWLDPVFVVTIDGSMEALHDPKIHAVVDAELTLAARKAAPWPNYATVKGHEDDKLRYVRTYTWRLYELVRHSRVEHWRGPDVSTFTLDSGVRIHLRLLSYHGVTVRGGVHDGVLYVMNYRPPEEVTK